MQLRQETEQYIAEQEAQKAQRDRQQQAKLQAEQFLMQAQKSSEEGLLEISLAHIEQGLLAVPNHSSLLALRKQLKSRIAEQQRQVEARHQQEEEARRQAEIIERKKVEQARQQAEAVRLHEEADQYLAQALNDQRNGDYSASLQKIEKGLVVVPKHNELLRLRNKVRAQWVAEQKRQNTPRRVSRRAKHQTSKSTTVLSKREDDVNLKQIQDIKNAIDALDKSLSR